MKLFFLILLLNVTVYAFPEMVRHHYVNCSACHVNTSGGGLLNAYGRSISSELLSTWGSSAEARAFYSIDPEKTAQWLNVGGDVRGLQLQEENSQFKRAQYIWMEANFQASALIDKTTLYFSFGQVKQASQSFDPQFAKYYLSQQVTDEFSVRAGRYIPVYGLNIPQHNYLVRSALTLGPGTERNAADIQYNGEKWNFTAGISKSLIDSAVGDEEQAYNFQVLYNIQDQHKVGYNYWYGESPNYRKLMMGLQGVFGWNEKLYTITEIDNIWKKDNLDVEVKSFYELFKTAYELTKGFHLQFVQEYGSTMTQTDPQQNIGIGFIWYPRPHFEFETLVSKASSSQGSEDYAYLLTHFYF
ncbi:MAG: hypothetical protein ACXVAX_11565 [Pseudobdellovibrio sp.]